MRYNAQTGGVEIALSELCALAFGRSNYHEEAESESGADAINPSTDAYYADVMLQNTCRYAGILIKTSGTAQGISLENKSVTLELLTHLQKVFCQFVSVNLPDLLSI